MKNIPKSDFISSRVRYIPLERIVPNPHQPRRDFDPEELEELAGCKLPGPDSVVEAIERLDREYRIPVIAVSMGSAGAIVKLSSGTLLRDWIT